MLDIKIEMLYIKMRKIYIALIFISILIYPVIGDDNSTKKPITYKVFVDNQGFGKVYGIVSNKVILVQNSTLNIYRGDSIIWTNDIDRRLTIVSEQNLWDNTSGLLQDEYKQFIYTFTNPGIYDVYIKEYSIYKQKIIVGPIEPNMIYENITNTKSNITMIITMKPINVTTVKQNSTSNVPNGIGFISKTIIIVIVLLSVYILARNIGRL